MRFIALSFVLLAGCSSTSTLWHSVTPEERAAREAQEIKEAQAAAEQYVSGLKTQCAAYGFKTGTDAFASCVMQQHQLNIQNLAARRQAQAVNNAAILQYSQGLLQMGQPHTLGSPGVTCMPNGIGGMTCR